MPASARLLQISRNLSEYGAQTTAYKVYYYLFGYIFDSFNGVDTTSPATAETKQADGTPRGDRTAAFPCHPWVLKRALRRLKVSDEDVFADIGCGKGRALVVASAFPFRRLVGVDLMRSHIEFSRRNLERVKCRRFQLIHADALKVAYPEDITICFLFKPFPEEMMLACLARMQARLRGIIVMGTDRISRLPGYQITSRYRHRSAERFNFVILERLKGADTDRELSTEPPLQQF